MSKRHQAGADQLRLAYLARFQLNILGGKGHERNHSVHRESKAQFDLSLSQFVLVAKHIKDYSSASGTPTSLILVST